MKFKQNKRTGWILYDFANSTYHLIMPTIIMPLYFRQFLAFGSSSIDLRWGLLVSVPVLFAGLFSPFLGAYADITNRRYQILFSTALAAIIFAIFIPFSKPGAASLGIWAFALSYFFFTLSLSIYDSFLPLIVKKTKRGSLSGLAWGLGYLGGIVALGFVYPFLRKATLPSGVNSFNVAIWITCFIYALFSLPAFILLRNRNNQKQSEVNPKDIIHNAINRVVFTTKQWRQNSDLFKTLASYYFANDGLATLVYFTSIYASVTLGFTNTQILALFLIVQIVGIPSSIIGGILADRLGHKRILFIVLGIWTILCLGFSFGKGPNIFYFLAVGTGLVIGTTPAIYRAYLSEFVAEAKTAELYGFNSFASRSSSVFGPLLFGLIASIAGNQRIAMLSLLLFFSLASVLLALISPATTISLAEKSK